MFCTCTKLYDYETAFEARAGSLATMAPYGICSDHVCYDGIVSGHYRPQGFLLFNLRNDMFHDGMIDRGQQTSGWENGTLPEPVLLLLFHKSILAFVHFSVAQPPSFNALPQSLIFLIFHMSVSQPPFTSCALLKLSQHRQGFGCISSFDPRPDLQLVQSWN